LQSSANGLLDAIYLVWGGLSRQMVKVDYTDNFLSCFGYIGEVGLSKPNSSYQLLVVNGRVVKDIGISKLVSNCFSQFLMNRQYPVFVLFITISPTEIDVNIHPNKLEIKFADKEKVNKAIASLCRKVAYQEVQTPSDTLQINTNNCAILKDDTKSQFVQNGDNNNSNNFQQFSIKSLNILSNTKKGVLNENPNDITKLFYSNKRGVINPNIDNIKYDTKSIDKIKSSNDDTSQSLFDDKKVDVNDICFANEFDAIILGRVFDTYIILQTENNLFMIDQHAAHEKLLYDKLCAKTDSGIAVQSLLDPYVFSLNTIYADKLVQLLPEFESFGFEIRQLSQQDFAIVAVPFCCVDINLREFVNQLNAVLEDKKILQKSNLLSHKLKQMACKAAIKAGTPLSENEIKSLLKDIKSSNIDLYCPHGRPISVRFGKTDIEKWFKRIV